MEEEDNNGQFFSADKLPLMVNYLAYPMAYMEEKRAIGNSFLNDVNTNFLFLA